MASVKSQVLKFVESGKDSELSFLVFMLALFNFGAWFGAQYAGTDIFNMSFGLFLILLFVEAVRSI